MSLRSPHPPSRPARVSVIVPCYNLGRYLDEAVQSVLDQTLQDLEILVVDDGSDDPETRRLLSEYARPKTRVVRTANAGLPAAKNVGLSHTSGPYVCMLDADDRLDIAYLERSTQTLDDNPDLAFVSHWFRTFGDEEWEWTPTRCDLETLLDTNTVNGAALVRRSALEAVGGFDETFREGCEDWDLWITLVERGFQGRILEEVLFYYRRRADSMSRAMMEGDRHPQLYRRLVEKHRESYRAHLESVLTRREKDLSHLAKQLQALELDYYRELGPELARRRDDVAMLTAKLEDSRRTDVLEQTVARERRALREASQRARELDAAANRAGAEVADLRASWSWRLTAPLRALLDAVQGLTGGRLR